MPYFVVKDFARGLDARRMNETTEPGALIRGSNCHITSGKELEKRFAFVKTSILPPGSHGLWVNEDNTYIVFGSEPESPFVPINVTYVRCQHPDGATKMHRVLSQDSFFGKPYVVAEFEDGTVHHFYNGERILNQGVPPDFVVPPIAPIAPPTPTPVGAGRASCTVRFTMTDEAGEISGLWVFSPQNWEAFEFSDIVPAAPSLTFPLSVTTANLNATLKQIADAINADVQVPKLNARASGNELVVSFADYGTQYNSWILSIGRTGGVSTNESNGWSYFSGGEANAPPPTPPGVVDDGIDPPEEFRWSPGRFATTHRQKMYATSGNLLYFSAIDNCRVYSPDATGAGFIDVTNHAKGSQELVAIGDYQDMLAIFARKQVQLWKMDPDPRLNQIIQVVHNSGTFAPRSVIEYGTGDVFYLDRAGIRSLQARQGAVTAFMNDVGSLIDRLVVENLKNIPEAVRQRATSIVEPDSGRLWFAVGSVVYVLSLYPQSQVSAWTVYEPGFQIDYLDSNSSRVAVRSGDDIYLYGGESGTDYGDDYLVDGQIPFLDGQRPATTKEFSGIDAALEGEWKVYAYLDPTRPTARATVGTLDRSTFGKSQIGLVGSSTHCSLRLTHKGAGPAKIGSLVIHYSESEQS
jgi:hypothetical protein